MCPHGPHGPRGRGLSDLSVRLDSLKSWELEKDLARSTHGVHGVKERGGLQGPGVDRALQYKSVEMHRNSTEIKGSVFK